VAQQQKRLLPELGVDYLKAHVFFVVVNFYVILYYNKHLQLDN